MGRSQRHMIYVQNAPANGEAIAEGQPAPGFILQSAEEPGAGLRGIEDINVAYGPPGGPLQGSTIIAAVPESIMPPEPPEPEPGVIVITSPTDGSTVPPVHDIIGTGANPGAEVQLWYAGQDPGEDPPASTTTADASGNWGFTGDTPAALGPVTWGVYSDGSLATVNITVVEDAPEADTEAVDREAGPFNITLIEDHMEGLQLTMEDGEFKVGDDVMVEATGNTNVNGAYEILEVEGLMIVIDSNFELETPIEAKGRLTITGAVV